MSTTIDKVLQQHRNPDGLSRLKDVVDHVRAAVAAQSDFRAAERLVNSKTIREAVDRLGLSVTTIAGRQYVSGVTF